jgi:hypothetical protein
MRIRLATGEWLQRSFHATDPVQMLFDFVAIGTAELGVPNQQRSYFLCQNFPKLKMTTEDSATTLQTMGFWPNATLHVEECSAESTRGAVSPIHSATTVAGSASSASLAAAASHEAVPVLSDINDEDGSANASVCSAVGDATGWTCAVCTYINLGADASCCAMCEADRAGEYKHVID